MLLVAQIAFYLVATVGAGYFLLRNRRFDFFSIGFAAGLVYFLPGFFGFVRSARDYSLPQPLLPETYLVFICVLASIVVGAFAYDRLRVQPARHAARTFSPALTTETALAIALAGLALTIATSGGDLFSHRKSEVMEVVGRWHILFRFGATFLFVIAIWRRQAVYAAIGAALLLFDLYIGFRVGVVIALLAAATMVLNHRGERVLLYSERRNLLLGVVLVAFFFIYKRIYMIVKLGFWDVLVERLTDPDVLLLALMTSEPFGTQSILNEVIRTGFDVGPSHLGGVTSLLIPFSNLLGAEIQSFNDLFQEKLFGIVRGGMANNIWAQMYAIGGWAALGIAIPVFVGCLALGSWLLSSSKGSLVALVAIAFTFVAFYIHRNDVRFILVLLRRCVMIWVVIVLPGMLLVDAARSSVSHKAVAARS